MSNIPKTLKIKCAGYSVVADFYAGKNGDKILLALIGWGSNRQNYTDLISSIVAQTGMSALVFDYSGHGESAVELGSTRLAQHFLEVVCVFDWLTAKYPSSQISVMGTSYGGYLAALLTQYREFPRLILRVPALYNQKDFYTPNKIVQGAGWVRAKAAYRKAQDLASTDPLLTNAPRFKGKTLVIVHENDEQIPQATTDAYIEAFKAGRYLAKGFSHSLKTVAPELAEEYQTAICRWLNNQQI